MHWVVVTQPPICMALIKQLHWKHWIVEWCWSYWGRKVLQMIKCGCSSICPWYSDRWYLSHRSRMKQLSHHCFILKKRCALLQFCLKISCMILTIFVVSPVNIALSCHVILKCKWVFLYSDVILILYQLPCSGLMWYLMYGVIWQVRIMTELCL